MTDYPLVSVGIITYNQKEYLRECIESVLAQDYPNIEMVVGDDASTDGTQEMLKEYDKEYPGKFRIILNKTNQGITKNSNSVLKNCKGKYIAWIGGDDLMLPGKIKKQVEYMEKNLDCNLCGTYTLLIDNNGNRLNIKKDFKKKKNPRYTLCELIESANTLIPVVSYMTRNSISSKLRFDNRLPVASDSLFFYQNVLNGYIYILPEILSVYRVHNSHAQKLGYKDDSLVSLALSEYYFPECLNSVRKARAKTYYSIGRMHMKNYNQKLARLFLWNSLMLNFTFKTLIALCILIINIKE